MTPAELLTELKAIVGHLEADLGDATDPLAAAGLAEDVTADYVDDLEQLAWNYRHGEPAPKAAAR